MKDRIRKILAERKKIVWPSAKQVKNNSVTVAGFTVMMGAAVIIMDVLFSQVMTLVLGL